jgi:hypothetical protein
MMPWETMGEMMRKIRNCSWPGKLATDSRRYEPSGGALDITSHGVVGHGLVQPSLVSQSAIHILDVLTSLLDDLMQGIPVDNTVQVSARILYRNWLALYLRYFVVAVAKEVAVLA